MKTLIALAVIGPALLVPDSVWIEMEAAKFMHDLRKASAEPEQGEPVAVSKLRNEISANWDKLLEPKLILDLDESDWRRLEREK